MNSSSYLFYHPSFSTGELLVWRHAYNLHCMSTTCLCRFCT